MTTELSPVPDIARHTIPAPPDHLGDAGAELWTDMLTEFSFDNEPQKIALLTRACKTADTIKKLEDYAASTSIETTGSMGQKVLSGAYSEIRQQTNTLASLIKTLNLPDSDEETAEKAARRSRAGKAGAAGRWQNRGGGA